MEVQAVEDEDKGVSYANRLPRTTVLQCDRVIIKRRIRNIKDKSKG